MSAVGIYPAQEIIIPTPLSQHNSILQCKVNILNPESGSATQRIFGDALCSSNFGYGDPILYK